MTNEEFKNKISECKECCKKLAEEYRQRYNEDNANKLALNMFYHNVIAYNNFETVLAMIEDRNSMIMCFSEPPILTEKTVEVEINRIAELEAKIEKMKKYGKLLQDICTVMGNDVYMVSVGLENRVKVLWDSSEEKEGLKMVEDIENRLLKIKPQEWAEITKWEIKEK